MTEKDLLDIINTQPQRGQKILYDEYAQGFFRISVRYCGNYQDAEEVLLNGFMKIFQHISSFRYEREGNMRGWMKRIIINEALMHLRKNRMHFSQFDSNVHDIQSFDLPDQNIEAEELFDIIKDLPAGYRTVFNLYVIEGYSHREIAHKLDISTSTSKSQLSKARLLLKKRLQEQEYEIRSI